MSTTDTLLCSTRAGELIVSYYTGQAWLVMPYGRACSACQHWLLLPRWAEVFVAWAEFVAVRPITGSEALMILAGVEMALQRLDSPWQERSQTIGILLWLNRYRRAQASHPRSSVFFVESETTDHDQ